MDPDKDDSYRYSLDEKPAPTAPQMGKKIDRVTLVS